LSLSFEIAKIIDHSTLLKDSKAVFDLLLSKTPDFESDESDYADYNNFSKKKPANDDFH